MYETAFGLQSRPFSATPDAACVFTPPPIRAILDQLVQRIEQPQGIVVLTGAAGTGKTLLCRALIQQLAGRFTVAYLSGAHFSSRRSLLQAILYEVGRPYGGMPEQELRLELRSYLKGRSFKEPTVLIVDEAHLITERTLEEFRILANLTEEGQSPVRVVLVGQLALEETLAQPGLAGLSQIIACQVCLEPFSQQESVNYLTYRIHWAGGDADRIFSRDALEAIARASGGLPRCLNQLADHSLLLAFVNDATQVEVRHVEEALSDLKQLPLHWNESLPREELIGTEAEDSPEVLTQSPVSEVPPLKEAFSIEIGGDDSETRIPPVQNSHEFCYSGRGIREDAEVVMPAPVAERAQTPDDFSAPADSEAIVSSLSFPLFDSSLPTSFDSAWQSAGGIVPVPGGSRQPVNLIEEEVVIDRYARIDSGLSAPAAEAAMIFRAAEMLQAQADEAVEIEMEPITPEGLLEDDVIPLIDEAISLEVEPVVLDVDPEELPEIEALDIKTFTAEETPLEEELEAEVFDICFDVQQSILDRLSPLDLEDEIQAEMPLPRYDAVEPEIPFAEEMRMAAPASTPAPIQIQHIDPPVAVAAAVPKPNYKLIFSTLRKKLGQGRR